MGIVKVTVDSGQARIGRRVRNNKVLTSWCPVPGKENSNVVKKNKSKMTNISVYKTSLGE